MRKSILSVVALLAVVSMLFTACATPTPQVIEKTVIQTQVVEKQVEKPVPQTVVVTEEKQVVVTATAVPAKKVEVNWWHISTKDPGLTYWQKLADDYMATHPNVTIKITVLENEAFKTKLTTVMQSGNPPDIFQSWGGGGLNDYAKAGLLKDITADLEKDGWKDTFAPGALGVFSYEGKYYGVPRDMGMVSIWYNKDLFAKAGIDKTPATWTEFLDTVNKLKAAGITPIALGAGDTWTAAFWWEFLAVRLGGKAAFDAAYTRTGAFTDAPFVEAGKKLQELTALEPFQPGFLAATWPDAQVIMANEEAAMLLMGQWAPGSIQDASVDKKGLGDKLGMFTFPMVEGGAGGAPDALGGGNGFTVGKDAEPEAVDFLKYISSLESQTEQAKMVGFTVPVVKGAEAGMSDPNLIAVQKGFADAEYFQLYYDQAMPATVGGVINDSVAKLLAGEMTPEEVAQAIDDSAAAELK